MQIYWQNRLSADTEYIGRYSLYRPIIGPYRPIAHISAKILIKQIAMYRPIIGPYQPIIGRYNIYRPIKLLSAEWQINKNLADIVSADYRWVIGCRYLADIVSVRSLISQLGTLFRPVGAPLPRILLPENVLGAVQGRERHREDDLRRRRVVRPQPLLDRHRLRRVRHRLHTHGGFELLLGSGTKSQRYSETSLGFINSS